jgi:hypothetical protein
LYRNWPFFYESVLSLYYRALANRSPNWCLLNTLFSWRHRLFHVVISFEDVQNTQTEQHIDSSWCIRMYYEDTVTMKTCFQMLKTCKWHCVICLDEEGIRHRVGVDELGNIQCHAASGLYVKVAWLRNKKLRDCTIMQTKVRDFKRGCVFKIQK